MRILVVEDEAKTADYLKRGLEVRLPGGGRATASTANT